MGSSILGSDDSTAMDESVDIKPENPFASSIGLSEADPKAQEREAIMLAKKAEILDACNSRDVDALIRCATTEGGLLEDALRQKAWPILLHCDKNSLSDLKPIQDLPPHTDEEQVKLDVDRSFVYYPNDLTEQEITEKKDQLEVVILKILRNYPMLCYFQGYHDIVQVFLLVLGEQLAVPAIARVSLFRIRDYMLRTLSPAIKHLELIPAILEATDPPLRQHLADIQPFFALAAALTLYAHDISEYSDISRLYDFLLAREPVVAIYLFAEIIISRKKELLDIPIDEPEMLHFTLSKLPQPLDLDGHILRAEQLFKVNPPETLPHGVWKRISRYSVLKTSRDQSQSQTVENALKLFGLQTQQLRNEERRKQALGLAWKHRRTIGSVALALLVGAASIYLRRKGLDSTIWSYAKFE
ncbi:hypothetical protein N7470_008251 [Penicillium chermesinum]|nr:hypothetical protein N7470_008251 [Penicillium chermesinum]